MGHDVGGIDLDAARLVLLLHRVTNVVVYDLESTVHRPAGWSWAAFRSLFVLWLAGPLESNRVAELTGMSRQAVSSLTKTLEQEGMIERQTSADDGRAVILVLTGRGRRRLEAAYRDHNRREAQRASALDVGERTTLIAAVVKARQRRSTRLGQPPLLTPCVSRERACAAGPRR